MSAPQVVLPTELVEKFYRVFRVMMVGANDELVRDHVRQAIFSALDGAATQFQAEFTQMSQQMAADLTQRNSKHNS